MQRRGDDPGICPRPFDFMKGFIGSSNLGETTSPLKRTQYMNVGWVRSPYPGKTGQGDWGPQQGGECYYRPGNDTYPYPMWTPGYPQPYPLPNPRPLYIRQQQGLAAFPY